MKAFINGLYLEFPEGQFSASRSNMEEGSFFLKKKKQNILKVYMMEGSELPLRCCKLNLLSFFIFIYLF